MSLRLRLTIILGAAFVLLWSIAATWMLFDLRHQLTASLDQRLAASARMVAGLLVQLPRPQQGDTETAALSTEQLGIPDGLACQISSLRGEVLARSHATPDSTFDTPRSGFHDQVIGGIAWRSFTLARGDLLITTADRLDERHLLNRSVLFAAAIPVAIALLGSLVVLWIGVSNGLAPLRRIRSALAQRSVDATEPLRIAGLPAELKPLVDTQNQLFQRIAQAIERERRLTDDAAHELRSPLTAIKTHLQVAAMTDGETARHALAQAEAGADHLHRTLEQLLLLARVEGRLPFDDGAHCSATQVAHLAIGALAQDAQHPIDLHIPGDMSPRDLAMPPALMSTALRNLLENAQRHTPAGTTITLELQQQGNRVGFSVRDHGPGVPAEALAHLTERFWRGASSTGSGLGLAIVHAIAERCGGELVFDSEPPGLSVTLWVDLLDDTPPSQP